MPGRISHAQQVWRRVFSLCAILLLPFIGAATIVDRIAVSVGEKIITDSEISQRIRLTAFENKQPPDLSTASRRSAVQKLIDQKLVEREMDVGRYPRMDSPQGEVLVNAMIQSDYKGNPAALDKALADAHLTRKELASDLARQSDLITFLNLRFRPAVQVTAQDLENFPPELRPQMEQQMTLERADHELDLWLKDQRKRTRIEYLERDLEDAG